MEPAWVAASAAVISSVAAAWSVRNGNRTLKRAELEGQARSRPMVTAELREPPLSDRSLLLIIRNYGPTVARNVVITFDPPLPDPSPEQAETSLAPFLKARYEKPIPVLTPGMELDNIYFTGQPSADGSGLKNAEELPDQVTVRIEYDATDGARYTDTYPLDVDIFRNRTYASYNSRHYSERLKTIEQALKGISTAIRALSKKFPGDTSSFRNEEPTRRPTEQDRD